MGSSVGIKGLEASIWTSLTKRYVASLKGAISEIKKGSNEYSILEESVALATRAFKRGEELRLTDSYDFKRLNQYYNSLLKLRQKLLIPTYLKLMGGYLASFKSAIDKEQKDEAEIFDNRLACFFDRIEQVGWNKLPNFTELKEQYNTLLIQHYNVLYC